jgi:hypothetical protein
LRETNVDALLGLAAGGGRGAVAVKGAAVAGRARQAVADGETAVAGRARQAVADGETAVAGGARQAVADGEAAVAGRARQAVADGETAVAGGGGGQESQQQQQQQQQQDLPPWVRVLQSLERLDLHAATAINPDTLAWVLHTASSLVALDIGGCKTLAEYGEGLGWGRVLEFREVWV